MARRLLFAFALFAVACGEPKSGDYLFEVDSTTSDCPGSDDTGDADVASDPIAIAVNVEKSEVDYAGVICPLDGETFECVFTDSETDYSSSGMDAVVAIYADIVGTWTSSSRISATYFSEVTCEGSSCAGLEEIGVVACSSTVEATGKLQR